MKKKRDNYILMDIEKLDIEKLDIEKLDIEKLDIETLIGNLDSVNIVDEETPYFALNNNIKKDNLQLNFITEVCLNFYEIWSIFREVPNINFDKKIKYSWIFESIDEKYIFVLCDWKNDKNLLQTRRWRILSNTTDDNINSKFLNVLCDAVECYNKYYKQSIESGNFTSDNKMVNKYLQEIKGSLIENKEIIKNL